MTGHAGTGTGRELRRGDPREIGPYRLLARLGSGGMGDVFLGRSPGGRLVAIKAAHPHLAADTEFVARFEREVTAARAVAGYCTATVVDADPRADRPWLATEYIPAPTLKQVVAQHGPLPMPAVEVLAAGLAEALEAIHAAGVVHRDLTPANVLVADNGPRVIDFGIARSSAQTRSLTATGVVIGSPGYLSPEQISDDPVGPAADVFALGAVLVFALTGQPPFGTGNAVLGMYRALHEPPRLSEVPEGTLRQVISACLAKDPARRPGPERILAALGRTPGNPAPPGWLPSAMTRAEVSVRSRPNRRTLLRGGAGLLAAGGVTAAAAWVAGDSVSLGTTTGAPAPGPPAGTLLWRTDVGAVNDRNLTPPAIAGDHVFAGSRDGNVYALDAATGNVAWKADLGRELSRAPLTAGDIVFACTSAGIAARDAATGQPHWVGTVPGDLLGVSDDPAMVYIVPATDHGIAALDPRNGEQRWSAVTDLFTFTMRSVGVGRGVVTVAWGSTVCTVDSATGKELWRHTIPGIVRADPYDSAVVVLGSSRGVVALRRDTGEQSWAFTNAYQSSYATTLGETLYVSGKSSRLYALDAGSGELRWMVRTETPQSSPIATRGDTLYCVWGDAIHALAAADGVQRWSTVVGGAQSGVRVSGNTLYGVADGCVYAVTG